MGRHLTPRRAAQYTRRTNVAHAYPRFMLQPRTKEKPRNPPRSKTICETKPDAEGPCCCASKIVALPTTIKPKTPHLRALFMAWISSTLHYYRRKVRKLHSIKHFSHLPSIYAQNQTERRPKTRNTFLSQTKQERAQQANTHKKGEKTRASKRNYNFTTCDTFATFFAAWRRLLSTCDFFS